MIKLTLLLFLFTIIATGYLQEVSDSLSEPPSNNDNAGTATKQLWLQQFQEVRKVGKPCPRRSNGNSIPDNSWIPSYTSKVSHPLYDPTALQPQALKNDEYKVPQVSTATENDEQNLASGRRSNDLTYDDCADELDAVNVGPTDSNSEKTALKIIEDCLKKRLKDQNALGSSRRSLSGPDSIDDDGNNYNQESEIDDLLDSYKVGETEDAVRRKGPSKKSHTEEETGLASSARTPANELNNLRICYACSTTTNPTCWEPDKRTTIKYCRKEHSCVTKTFGVKNQLTLIRDCANSCMDSSVSGIEPNYKTCKVCHDDYCNSAISISLNGYSLLITLIISVVKCTY